MPVYVYRCGVCGESTDHVVPYVRRQEDQDCPLCGAPGSAKYGYVDKITTTLNPVRPRKDDGRIIWDERQVTSEKGPDWREEGTNRRPGGAGAKLYFH